MGWFDKKADNSIAKDIKNEIVKDLKSDIQKELKEIAKGEFKHIKEIIEENMEAKSQEWDNKINEVINEKKALDKNTQEIKETSNDNDDKENIIDENPYLDLVD